MNYLIKSDNHFRETKPIGVRTGAGGGTWSSLMLPPPGGECR